MYIYLCIYIYIYIYILKHFSCKLRNIRDLMFLSWHFDLFFFFVLFLGKKSVLKTLLQHIFVISDALFVFIWHKLYYQHKIWSLRMKKVRDNICCKRYQTQSDHLKIDQSCFTESRIL